MKPSSPQVPPHAAAIVAFVGAFGGAWWTFLPTATSTWEPLVGAFIIGLTFGSFAFLAQIFPRLLPFWLVMIAIFFGVLWFNPASECVISSYCSSSPFAIALLYATFLVDLAMLARFLSVACIALVLKNEGGRYVLFGGIMVFLGMLMALAYVRIGYFLKPYHAPILIAFLALNAGIVGFGRGYERLRPSKKREKWLMLPAFLLSIVLLVLLIPFGDSP